MPREIYQQSREALESDWQELAKELNNLQSDFGSLRTKMHAVSSGPAAEHVLAHAIMDVRDLVGTKNNFNKTKAYLERVKKYLDNLKNNKSFFERETTHWRGFTDDRRDPLDKSNQIFDYLGKRLSEVEKTED